MGDWLPTKLEQLHVLQEPLPHWMIIGPSLEAGGLITRPKGDPPSLGMHSKESEEDGELRDEVLERSGILNVYVFLAIGDS